MIGARSHVALVGLVVLGGLVAPRADASTLGLLRCTDDGPAWRSSASTRADETKPRVLRDPDAFAALWRQLAMRGPLPAVDFAHDMILVLPNPARVDRVIYRVQLDDGDHPRALEVHVAGSKLPCADGHTPDKAAVHIVQTRRSLLPVRFIADEMIDGRLFVGGFSREGVGETELAVIAPPPETTPPAPDLPITTREGAEQRVVAALSPTERKQLLRGPLENHPLKRVPHGWTALAVTYANGIWSVRYDTLQFTVDATTGAVTRRP